MSDLPSLPVEAPLSIGDVDLDDLIRSLRQRNRIIEGDGTSVAGSPCRIYQHEVDALADRIQQLDSTLSRFRENHGPGGVCSAPELAGLLEQRDAEIAGLQSALRVAGNQMVILNASAVEKRDALERAVALGFDDPGPCKGDCDEGFGPCGLCAADTQEVPRGNE